LLMMQRYIKFQNDTNDTENGRSPVSIPRAWLG
jgi:hypothetical protein